MREKVGKRWDGEGKCGGNEVKLETRGRVVRGLLARLQENENNGRKGRTETLEGKQSREEKCICIERM